MSNIEKLEKRITELEAEVALLKAAPPQQVIHYHYTPAPWIPAPTVYPLQPQPHYPYSPYIVCGGGVGLTA